METEGILMIVDMSRSKEPPPCWDRILEDGSELCMQGKGWDLELYTLAEHRQFGGLNHADVAWLPSRAKFVKARVMEPQCRCPMVS